MTNHEPFQQNGGEPAPEAQPPDSQAFENLRTLQLLSRELKRQQLLTAEQEAALSRSIMGGQTAQAQKDSRTYDKEFMPWDELIDDNDQQTWLEVQGQQAAELAGIDHQISEGQEAKQYLVLANNGLVVSFAKKYADRGLPLIDLVQEGAVGLVKAAEKYDWRKGARFSTFATYHVRKAVISALNDRSRAIRLPRDRIEELIDISRANARLLSKLQRQPTEQEIADDLMMPLSQVQELKQLASAPISLQQPVGEDAQGELGQFLADTNSPNPEIEASITFRLEGLLNLLGQLSEKERKVIEMRYGLNGSPPQTLLEVGRHFGITKQGINQLESRALKKLFQLPEADRLRDAINE